MSINLANGVRYIPYRYSVYQAALVTFEDEGPIYLSVSIYLSIYPSIYLSRRQLLDCDDRKHLPLLPHLRGHA